MNCRDIESLLLAEEDGMLSKEQRAALTGHVANCARCAAVQSKLQAARQAYLDELTAVKAPDANREWEQLQNRLRKAPATPAKRRPLAPVIWFGAPLAAAAAFAFIFFFRPAPAPSASPVPAPTAALAELSEPAASTISYVDKDSGWLVVWTTEATGQVSG